MISDYLRKLDTDDAVIMDVLGFQKNLDMSYKSWRLHSLTNI